MAFSFKGADILSIGQFQLEDIEEIMRIAEMMLPYSRREKITKVLDGAVLANLFFEPSTRTRMSFASAFMHLGGAVNSSTGIAETSISKGESLHDTARVISGYADIIVVRHPEAGAAAKFAAATDLPVINAGDGPAEHPTQALLDCFAIKSKFGGADGLKIAMVGDLKYGRTVHSLSKLLALYKKVTFKFIAPEAIQMPDYVKALIEESGRGHKIEIFENLQEGVADADVIYSTRIQQERFSSIEEADLYRGRYAINRDFIEKFAKANSILMHPLPRDSREGGGDFSHNLNGLENLMIFKQSDFGVPVRMALFAMVLDVVDKIKDFEGNISWHVPKRIDPENPPTEA